MSTLFTRSNDKPGVHGTLRDCTPQGKGLKRLGTGDIAVIDSPDLTRREAQTLAKAKPAAVVNLAAFTTGVIPNYGPHLLLDEDITLIDNLGAEARSALRGGKKATVTEAGEVYLGQKQLGTGTVVTRETANASFNEAQSHLVDHMEAYFGNTIEFIHSEAPLLIDGVGIPDLGDELEGRKVLIVAPDPQVKERLGRMRSFIREYNPILIGVSTAADVMFNMGYKPHYIVADPTEVSTENLRGGARVVLPAAPDGHAVGLERIQDLGVGAMTFPSALDSPMDLAVLLAIFHDAQMVVTVGQRVDLDALFAHEEFAGPSSLLTRLKGGARVVDSQVIEDLYNVSSGRGVAWAWAVLALLVALAVIIVVVGLGGDDTFTNNLINTWNNIALTVQGWFKALF